ncbi:LANO_0F16688g1_1 [Lachancea nothofagi CBS 11611]|uniref:LANO_0F16688g1_1 n=1 Tax=Lachancea nothofagi CBS 11611 TaxID=1266666 RepID=A0A1G4KD24_9SACH|nr:LANO_0F16688g1_1 [Lachancea nothofagi CBS 11611]
MLENPSIRLRNAVISGKLLIVKRILNRAPDLLTDINSDNGWSLLHYASYYGKYLVCVHLVQLGHGKDEILKTFKNNTCVHLALLNGHEQTAHLLFQHFPYCLNMRGHRGLTPVQMACLHDHHRCLNLLLGLGANLSLRDDDNYSALHTCLKYGSVNCMRMLILEGDLVDQDTQKVGNWIPEDLCQTFELVEVYHKVLKEKRSHQGLPKRPSYQSMVSPLTIPKPVFENSGSPVLSSSSAIQTYASQLPPLPTISTSRRTSVGSQNVWSPKIQLTHTLNSNSPSKKKLSSLNRMNSTSSISLANREISLSSSSARARTPQDVTPGCTKQLSSPANYDLTGKHSTSTMSFESAENGLVRGASLGYDTDNADGSRDSVVSWSKLNKLPSQTRQLSLMNIPISKLRNRA